jgi:hypothetical protein
VQQIGPAAVKEPQLSLREQIAELDAIIAEEETARIAFRESHDSMCRAQEAAAAAVEQRNQAQRTHAETLDRAKVAMQRKALLAGN